MYITNYNTGEIKYVYIISIKYVEHYKLKQKVAIRI